MQLGYLAADAGRLQEARELQERALALWTEFIPNNPLVRGRSCSSWPTLTPRSASPGPSPVDFEQALAIFLQVGDRVGVAYCEQALRASRTRR